MRQSVDSVDLASIVSTFGATLLGVFTAFFLNSANDRRKRKVEKNAQRRTVIKTLKNELELNFKRITTDTEHRTYPDVYYKLGRIALDSAVSSGNLSLLDAKMMSEVEEVYLSMRYAEIYALRLLELWKPSGAATEGDELRVQVLKMLTDTESTLQKAIPRLVSEMDKELND